MQRLVAGGRSGPGSDPKFAVLRAEVAVKRRRVGVHPPSRSEAGAAQAAAVPPQDDRLAQGKAANAEKMNAAKPGGFDKAAFVKAVEDAIAAQAPKNLDEADKFATSGKAGAVKEKVAGQVNAGRQASAGAITSATNAPPDTSRAVDKPVTPLRPDQPPPAPGTPNPANAVPDPAPAAATDLSAGPAQVDQQMAAAQVTDQQLANSNEPEFTTALADKKAGEQHAATAPGKVRAAEAKTLAGAKAQAGQVGATAMAGMVADRAHAGQQVASGKGAAKSTDETRRAQVTAKLQAVFDATRTDVEAILSGLDKKVDDTFTTGEKAARDAFTADHKTRMDAYKAKRYGGFTGKLRWVKDKFAGLPEEANQIFTTARAGYVARMRQVISTVADVIGAELTRAKTRIATGRQQIHAEVAKLPADLKAIGNQAATQFTGRFNELDTNVDAKSQELVNALASKYTDALKSVDQEIDTAKAANQGLVAKAIDAVGGVIKTILQLKDMLLGVLAKAASAVAAIIKDPIGFLGHLVTAVGTGIKAFLTNIGTHLRGGLVGWLTGALASAGLQLPDKWDLRGIFGLIASLLGLAWAAIRGRIIARGLPDQAMSTIEQSVPMVQKVQSEGVLGLWEEIKDKIGDLRTNLFSKISEYLIPTIITAGITWILSLLNPASAFVRAVKMIIDFVSFIINQGAQILEFVNSVLDAIIAIAGGAAAGVPALIEKALARSVPVLIGALAAILGIGGIADKIKSFFHALAKPIHTAIDWVVGKIVTIGKKIWAKVKGLGTKIKGKIKDKFGKKKDGGGKPGADTAGPLRATQNFTMSGAPHTLTGTLTGGRLRLLMASSSPGALMAKANLARKSLQESHKEAAVLELESFARTYAPRISTVESSQQNEENKKRVVEQLLRDMAAELVAIGSRHHLTDLGSYTALGLGEVELNRLVYEAIGLVRRDVLRQRDQTAKTPSSEDEQLQERFDRMMHGAAAEYRRACRATTTGDAHSFEGNVFSFGGNRYFVDSQHNYIVPFDQVGANRGRLGNRVYVASKPVLSSTADLDSDPARRIIDQFAYTGQKHTSTAFADYARMAAYGIPLDPVAGTMFLAAMIAEAERNPNAHVTNLLLLGEGGSGTFYEAAPMTRGGSDNPTAPRDPTLTEFAPQRGDQPLQPPTEITNAEIALVRSRFEESEGMPLHEIVEHLGITDTKADLVEFLKRSAGKLTGG